MGSTTLLHPDLNNIEQVVIRLHQPDQFLGVYIIQHIINSSIVIACATSCNVNYSGSTHIRVQIDGLKLV